MDQKDIRKISEKAAAIVVFTLTMCVCAFMVAITVIGINFLWGMM